MVNTYQNPILRGMYPDPSITRVASTYYLVNSTFEYYPGIALAKSTDLLNWQKLPGIVQSPKQADLRQSKSNEGIFAVCLRYYDGHFYVITTNFAEFKTFLIRGKLDPTGQQIIWEQNRVVIDVPGIDPDLYFENKHAYVQFTGYLDKTHTKAIRQVQIDLLTGKILRGPEVLTYGTGGRDIEGPHIIKNHGWYYLLTAEGGTGLGHMVTIFRSQNLWGPYSAPDKVNPLFTNRDRADQALQSIGHADLFQDNHQNWWLTCLGTRPASVDFSQITNLGRETLLYPVDWSEDWPVIYQGIPTDKVDLSQFTKHKQTLTAPQKLPDFVDDFSNKELNAEWLSLRGRIQTLKTQPHKLTLTGNQYVLTDLATPAFLGIRQTEHHEKFIVNLDSNSNVNHGSLGVAVVINADHFWALMIRKGLNNDFQVYRQQQIADVNVEKLIGTLKSLPTNFEITNSPATKKFTVKTETQQLSFTADSINLSNQAVAALNTGDIQGIYATDDAKMVVNKVQREKINTI